MTDGLLRFELSYPDVLTAITPTRVTYEAFQAAVGLFPRQVFINQPLEVVVILQSLIDQPLSIRIGLVFPAKDGAGKPMAFEAPQQAMSVHLEAGEVVAVRLPVMVVPPTQPGSSLPLSVTLQSNHPRHFRVVRTAAGGGPPSALTVSPFKLLVLRDVHYAAAPVGKDRERVRLAFDVNGRQLPSRPTDLKPIIERLWTRAQYPAEREAVAEKLTEARELATTFNAQGILEPFFDAVTNSFASRGLPLHPGEALAIAKLLTYIIDFTTDVTDVQTPLESLRWFQSLCQLLAAEPEAAALPPGDLVAGPLLEAVLYDAVIQGFSIVRTRAKTSFGEKNERAQYANRLLAWFTGQSEPDATYIYLPLALAGVAVNAQIVLHGEDPWELLDAIQEAARGRVRLASRNVKEVFDLLDKLVERGADDLRRARIQRQ